MGASGSTFERVAVATSSPLAARSVSRVDRCAMDGALLVDAGSFDALPSGKTRPAFTRKATHITTDVMPVVDRSGSMWHEPFGEPRRGEALEGVLDTIIGNLSCDVQPEGQMRAACEIDGTVTLGGIPHTLDTDSVVLPDGHTIRWLGEACTRLQADGGNLVEFFPCDVVVL